MLKFGLELIVEKSNQNPIQCIIPRKMYFKLLVALCYNLTSSLMASKKSINHVNMWGFMRDRLPSIFVTVYMIKQHYILSALQSCQYDYIEFGRISRKTLNLWIEEQRDNCALSLVQWKVLSYYKNYLMDWILSQIFTLLSFD